MTMPTVGEARRAAGKRTPVLVGAGSVMQRLEDPSDAREAVALMVAACETAAGDAGCRDLLRAAGSIVVPQGMWSYTDPGRLVAAALGARAARTTVARLGILQTELIGRAAADIAAGRVDVAIVVGGEARYRDLRATITGMRVPETTQDDAVPDEVLVPDGEIISPREMAAGLVSPVNQYATIENALRHHDGLDLETHAAEVAKLWAGFNAVAAGNPFAWNPQPLTADDIRMPGPRNRMLAFPYAKWHSSQWNVDQAAALILCSADAARAHSVPVDRWVFPLAVCDANQMVPVSERTDIWRSPGFGIAFRRALALTGTRADGIAHVDLYSCYPAAVRVQLRELGLSADRALTVTGGMTFAGGPLNNYVLQSTAAMAAALRADPGSTGLVTAVSGMLTKQGVSLWSGAPGSQDFRHEDVTAEVAASTARVACVNPRSSPATIASYTVSYAGDRPERAIAICDLPDGTRTIAVCEDASHAAAMTWSEWCGRQVAIRDDGTFVA
jgi:acetyl-CoA C-acetyltransferase